MSFNGAGVFNRLYNWVADAANGINIQADRMDNEMNGFADGLSLCLTRDSRAAMIADLKMGGFGIINLKDPVNDQDAATKKFVQSLLSTGATVSDAAPANPIQGQLWFRTSAPVGLYAWVQDATSGAWKIASGEYSVPSGMIMIWSGLLTALPVGWKLCDGTNGTPNLQDKFVIGAGATYAKDATGGKTAITEVPKYGHGVGTLAVGGGDHTHTVTDPGHSHAYTDSRRTSASGTLEAGGSSGSSNTTDNKTTSPATTGITVSGGAHTHTMSGQTADTGPDSVEILPPYYALAYIMKT